MEKAFGILLLALVLIFGLALLFAIPVWLLWNALMPDIFGLPSISFWQALAKSPIRIFDQDPPGR